MARAGPQRRKKIVSKGICKNIAIQIISFFISVQLHMYVSHDIRHNWATKEKQGQSFHSSVTYTQSTALVLKYNSRMGTIIETTSGQ